MNLEHYISEFKNIERIMHAKKHLNALLYFDSVTVAPRGSTEARAKTMELSSEEIFKILTAPETVEVVNALRQNSDKIDYQTAREAEIFGRNLDQIIKMPMQEYVDYQLLLNSASDAWFTAKNTNDYELFKPYLKRIIDANIKLASYIDSSKKPYDALLGEYEYGFTMADYDPYFKALQKSLVPTLHAIAEMPQPETTFLKQSFSIEKQKKLSERIIKLMGIDKNHCSIAESEHPFSLSFSKYDVRITTHYYENSFASSLYSVIHEGGHAIYELNTGDELQFTPLADGCSLGFHESQSRFYENIIGRSEEFISLLMPILRELFPEQMKGISEAKLYRGLNIVEPSLIRIEADELSYSLHVLIRYEIEKQLISGNLSVNDAPKYWNELYKKYLGVDVPDNSHGILQDSHWAGGDFGYFPTYSLGSAYAAQILSKINEEFDVYNAIKENNIVKITKCLNKNIHVYGKLYDPKETLLKCCKAPLDPQFYFDYLNNKYKKIYNL